MRQAFSFILICIAACIVGIGSAWIVLEDELRFDKVYLGQWEIWPTAGEVEANPYTKAYLARKGMLWMGVTEGLLFFANKDVEGKQLNSACTYTLNGKIPRGRLWTLTAEAQNFARAAKPNNIHYITSADTIWQEDGQLSIAVSNKAQPGNWLQVDNAGDFDLILRIYDTPLTSGALDAAIETPAITKGDCL